MGSAVSDVLRVIARRRCRVAVPWLMVCLSIVADRSVWGAADLWQDPAFRDYRAAAQAYNQRQYERAIALAEKSLARYPDNVLALELAGDACVLLKQPARAVPYYERLRARFAAYRETEFKLAEAYDLAGRQDDARRVYQGMLKITPTDRRVLKHLMLLELGSHRDTSALKHALSLLNGWQWENERVEDVLVMFEAAGKLDGLAVAIEDRARTLQTPAAMRAVALHYFNAGRHARALPWWKKLVQARPTDAEAMTCLGTCHYHMKRFDQAAAWYRKAIRADREFVDAWYNLGVVLLGKNQPKLAIQAFRGVILIDPDLPDVYEQIGQIYENQLLELEMAKAYYEKARQVRQAQKRAGATQPSTRARRGTSPGNLGRR